MSRSYKKYPHWNDYSRKYTKWAKRQASKRVRRTFDDIDDGSAYKRVFPTWDIHDYSFVEFRPRSVACRDYRGFGFTNQQDLMFSSDAEWYRAISK